MTRSARDVARHVLAKVEQGSYATLALAGSLERSGLSAADRGLATELVYGVLRHRTRIDRALHAAADRQIKVPPRVFLILRMAAYQLLFLDRVPPHAAVHDAVEATKRMTPRLSKFVNAILRAVATRGEPAWPDDMTAAERAETMGSMPQWLVIELARAVPEAQLESAALAFSNAPAVALRCRSDRSLVEQQLMEERPRALVTASPWSPEALLAHKLGEVGTLPARLACRVVVQDVGAQLVAHLVSGQPRRILDGCSGLGGKAMHLCDRFPQAEVVASDSNEAKLRRLSEIAQRLGVSARVESCDLRNPPETWRSSFDAVVLDAPCSGLGVLRRHPERKWREAPQENLVQLQAELLDAMAALVAPGGQLVYSVCTFVRAEGREQVQRFLARHPEFVLRPPKVEAGSPPWDELLDDDGFLTTWPHRHDADGFFAARLERRVIASAE